MRNFLQRIFKFSQPNTSDCSSDLEQAQNNDQPTTTSSSSTIINTNSTSNSTTNSTTSSKRSKKSTSGGLFNHIVADRLTHVTQIIESYRQTHYYPQTTSNFFYVLRNTSYSPNSIIESDGYLTPTSFEKVLLPNDFIGISQILCVSSKIYVLEVGTGKVCVFDGLTKLGFIAPFDGTKLKVVAIRGDTYGILFWVYDTEDDCFLLYGADQNHYDNIGIVIDVPMTAVLAFDPRSVSSGSNTKLITHVECAYSLSFCVTNGVEIRCSGQIIWCRPNNTSTTWRDVVFTTRSPIIDLQTHSFGFVALLSDSTICVGGSNNHYESMHDTIGSYLDIRYITGLTFVPKQIFASNYSTIVKTTEDKFIEYGRGFANGNLQSGPNGLPFQITSPNFDVVKDMQMDNIYLKGGLIVSFEESPDLRFIYTEGGVNGVLKLSKLFPTSMVISGKVKCAANTSYFVFYEGIEEGMNLEMGRKLFKIVSREDKPLCDISIIVRDASYVSYISDDLL